MAKTKEQVEVEIRQIEQSCHNNKERSLRGLDLGRLYYELKDYSKAQSCLQSFLRVIESDPSNGRLGGSLSGAHRLLGDLSVAEHHPERAISSYSRAFELHPEPNANLIPKICELFCSTWQASYIESAKVWLERGRSKFPNDPKVCELQLKCVNAQKQLQAARPAVGLGSRPVTPLVTASALRSPEPASNGTSLLSGPESVAVPSSRVAPTPTLTPSLPVDLRAPAAARSTATVESTRPPQPLLPPYTMSLSFPEQPASTSRITAPSIVVNTREDRESLPTRTLAETLRAAVRDAEHDTFHTPAARPKFNYQTWLMQQAANAASTTSNSSAYPSLDGGRNSVDGPATLTLAPNRQYAQEPDAPPTATIQQHIAQLIEQNRELSGIAVGMMDQFVQSQENLRETLIGVYDLREELIRSRSEAQRVRQASEHRSGVGLEAGGRHDSTASSEAIARLERTISEMARQHAAFATELREVSHQVTRIDGRLAPLNAISTSLQVLMSFFTGSFGIGNPPAYGDPQLSLSTAVRNTYAQQTLAPPGVYGGSTAQFAGAGGMNTLPQSMMTGYGLPNASSATFSQATPFTALNSALAQPDPLLVAQLQAQAQHQVPASSLSQLKTQALPPGGPPGFNPAVPPPTAMSALGAGAASHQLPTSSFAESAKGGGGLSTGSQLSSAQTSPQQAAASGKPSKENRPKAKPKSSSAAALAAAGNASSAPAASSASGSPLLQQSPAPKAPGPQPAAESSPVPPSSKANAGKGAKAQPGVKFASSKLLASPPSSQAASTSGSTSVVPPAATATSTFSGTTTAFMPPTTVSSMFGVHPPQPQQQQQQSQLSALLSTDELPRPSAQTPFKSLFGSSATATPTTSMSLSMSLLFPAPSPAQSTLPNPLLPIASTTAAPSTASAAPMPSVFGSASQATNPNPLFTNLFTQAKTTPFPNLFGQLPTSSTNVLTAKPSFAAPSPSTFGFGAVSSAAPSIFGTGSSAAPSIFGTGPSAASLFGVSTSAPSLPGANTASSSKPNATSGSVSSSSSSTDVEIVKVVKANPEQVERARRFQLPDNFYSFENELLEPGQQVIDLDALDSDQLKTALSSVPLRLHKVKPDPDAAGASSTAASTTISKPTAQSATGGLFSNLKGLEAASFDKAEVKPLGFNKQEGFHWGGAGSSLFGATGSNLFGGSDKKNLSVKAAGEANEDDSGDETQPDPAAHVEFEPTAVFKPVLTELPPLVETVTGEEDDQTIFTERAAVYHFSNGAWRERGRGAFKVAYNKSTGRVRLLLRREQVHKLACNHYLNATLNFGPASTNKKALTWQSVDYAERPDDDGDPNRIISISVRFKTEQLATTLLKCVQAIQEIMRSNDSAKLTREQADRVIADYLPSDSPSRVPKPSVFSLNTSNAKPSDSSLAAPGPQSLNNPNASATGANASSAASLFGGPSTTSTSSLFSNTNNSASVTSGGGGLFTSKLVSSTSASASTTSSGGGLFTSKLVSSTSPSTPTTSSGGGLFHSLNLLPSNSSSTPTTSSGGLFANLNLVSSTSATVPATGGLFSNVNLTSFSTIASNAGEVQPLGFAKTEGFKWGGTGGSLFGNSNTKNNDSKSATGAESGDEGSDSEQQQPQHAEHFEPSAIFQPVLKELPPLVEAVTGEEDDRVLFSERAAIYHFSNQAWRERGRGSFKLTYHVPSGKFRLLLRREQVLKLACNHVLTRELNFSLNATNKKALSWLARDFAEIQEPVEDPDKPVLISLRFKHEQQAARLLQCVQEVQTRLREVNGDSLPLADADAILSRYSSVSGPDAESAN